MDGISPSTDVMFGGLITFLVALAGVFAERKHASKLRKQERLDNLSAIGFSIQVKLSTAYGWSRSLERAINECFEESSLESRRDFDPGVRVKPLTGVSSVNLEFKSEELALILETGDQGLVERLLALQWNIATTSALLHSFNVARREYTVIFSELATSITNIDGNASILSIPIEKRPLVEARVGELNVVIGELCECLPLQMAEIKLLLARVETAFRSINGLTFRTIGFVG